MVDTIFGMEVDKKDIAELDRAMKRVSTAVWGKELKKNFRKSAKPLVNDIKSKINVLSGVTSKFITIKSKAYRGTGILYMGIGPRKGSAPGMIGANNIQEIITPSNIIHLIEGGTRPHQISSRGGLMIGDSLVRGTVNHPGQRANPVMGNAAKRRGPKVFKDFRTLMIAGIDRQVRKQGKDNGNS